MKTTTKNECIYITGKNDSNSHDGDVNKDDHINNYQWQQRLLRCQNDSNIIDNYYSDDDGLYYVQHVDDDNDHDNNNNANIDNDDNKDDNVDNVAFFILADLRPIKEWNRGGLLAEKKNCPRHLF